MTSEYWSEVLKYLRIYGGDDTAIAVAQRAYDEAQERELEVLGDI